MKDGKQIQKWKCQFDDGEVWTYGFDKLMQEMTYQKIYPFGMMFENDKFTDEEITKHPTTPDKTCEVDKDGKPEIASQALSKLPSQLIFNKYKDNVDPTKNLCCSNRVKEKKKQVEDYITESTTKDEASVTNSMPSSSTNDTANEILAKPSRELPVKKSREMRNLKSDFELGYYRTAQANSTTLKVTKPDTPACFIKRVVHLAVTNAKKFAMGSMLLLPGSNNLYPQGYIPNTNQMYYPQDDVYLSIKGDSILPKLEPYTLQTFCNMKIDKVEQQRAYHTQIFKLNCLLNPDLITERSFDIISHNQI